MLLFIFALVIQKMILNSRFDLFNLERGVKTAHKNESPDSRSSHGYDTRKTKNTQNCFKNLSGRKTYSTQINSFGCNVVMYVNTQSRIMTHVCLSDIYNKVYFTQAEKGLKIYQNLKK